MIAVDSETSEIKERITEILERAMHGRTQRDFARDLGVELNSLQRWLKGKSIPVIDKYPAIARTSGKKVEHVVNYVLFGKEQVEEDEITVEVAEDVLSAAKKLSTFEIARLISMLAHYIAQENTPSDTKVYENSEEINNSPPFG